MIELILMLVATGLSSGIISIFAGWKLGTKQRQRRDVGFDPPPPPSGRWSRERHPHRWDTMFADGQGWRCGICGKQKGEKK